MTDQPRIPRRRPLSANVGVMGVGHHTYWDQFDGFRDELMGKYQVLLDRLTTHGVTVHDFGLSDRAQPAYAALPKIKAADLDLLFVDMLTYATSSTFGAICREVSCPIVLVALQPTKAMDYARGTTRMQLAHDDLCSVPEFMGVAIRLGRPAPELVLGTLHDDPDAEADIAEWCQVAKVLHDVRRARIGHMGHVLESMLDMHSDPTGITAAFGCHVVQCEPEEILARYRQVSDEDIDSKSREILGFFETPDPVSDPITRKLTDEDLRTAARVAVALDHFVDDLSLDGLAYYYEAAEGSELRTVVTNLIVGNSLLAAAGFPMCGEFDLKTCLAMLIMDRLDIGGSFAEFHPIDFERGTVLVGHDGPHHLNVADGRPSLRSLTRYHGKPGGGASVEFQLKRGPISMLSIGLKADGRPKFIIGEGESVAGPIPPTGNTNTHARFPPDVVTFFKRWVAQGPTHHFALGIGHKGRALGRVARSLGIEYAMVTGEEGES
jgi:L-arabinose isomerase